MSTNSVLTGNQKRHHVDCVGLTAKNGELLDACIAPLACKIAVFFMYFKYFVATFYAPLLTIENHWKPLTTTLQPLVTSDGFRGLNFPGPPTRLCVYAHAQPIAHYTHSSPSFFNLWICPCTVWPVAQIVPLPLLTCVPREY